MVVAGAYAGSTAGRAAAAEAGVRTNVHIENELMRVYCHSGDLAGALHVLQVRRGIHPIGTTQLDSGHLILLQSSCSAVLEVTHAEGARASIVQR